MAAQEQFCPQIQVSPTWGRHVGTPNDAVLLIQEHNSAGEWGRQRWLSEGTAVALDDERESVLFIMLSV